MFDNANELDDELFTKNNILESSLKTTISRLLQESDLENDCQEKSVLKTESLLCDDANDIGGMY